MKDYKGIEKLSSLKKFLIFKYFSYSRLCWIFFLSPSLRIFKREKCKTTARKSTVKSILGTITIRGS